MTQTQKEKDYIKNLKKLVIKIQEGSSDEETLKQLEEVKDWICYGNNDRLLLNELIKNAEEYLNLEKSFADPQCIHTQEDIKARNFHVSWFNEISSDLKEYDTTLYQIYYCIKNPSEQFTLKRNQFSY